MKWRDLFEGVQHISCGSLQVNPLAGMAPEGDGTYHLHNEPSPSLIPSLSTPRFSYCKRYKSEAGYEAGFPSLRRKLVCGCEAIPLVDMHISCNRWHNHYSGSMGISINE